MPFTPVHSLMGGALLFSSTSFLMKLSGRVLGISGIVYNAFFGEKQTWQRIFLGGMSAATLLMKSIRPLWIPSVASNDQGLLSFIGAGLLVGIGTKLGSGCTSGHMLCGIARLSKRSIVASATFFATGSLTANYLYNPSIYISPPTITLPSQGDVFLMIFSFVASISTFYIIQNIYKSSNNKLTKMFSVVANNATAFFSGFYFAVGLVFSGMTDPKKVLSFLRLAYPSQWDPSLLMVVLGGLLPGLLMWQFYTSKQKAPLFDRTFHLPTKRDIDLNLILGAAIFGVGWGLKGICPGPAVIVAIAHPSVPMFSFWSALFVGMNVAAVL
eukprot:TRINITY_DN2759_c0_g1_i1.p1 TRINITY_DN2759_c0_g1~~TRINITY_DN2759_c0_g1_i1.p1  ORF type:complete len:335 (-),score=61.12 TRINITY_DN2759_c0_g1_i1:21-1001(-)